MILRHENLDVLTLPLPSHVIATVKTLIAIYGLPHEIAFIKKDIKNKSSISLAWKMDNDELAHWGCYFNG